MEYGNPVERYGIILMNQTHEAFYNAGDTSGLVITLANSIADTVEDA